MAATVQVSSQADVEGSLLVKAIRYRDANLQMPLAGRLPEKRDSRYRRVDLGGAAMLIHVLTPQSFSDRQWTSRKAESSGRFNRYRALPCRPCNVTLGAQPDRSLRIG